MGILNPSVTAIRNASVTVIETVSVTVSGKKVQEAAAQTQKERRRIATTAANGSVAEEDLDQAAECWVICASTTELARVAAMSYAQDAMTYGARALCHTRCVRPPRSCS